MRVHRFITAAFIAYAVMTNACMLPIVSANAPDTDPHAHHDASHGSDTDAKAHHESDCAHGHCFGHGLPAAIAEGVVAQGSFHEAVPFSARFVFPSIIDSMHSHAPPLTRPDPPGRIRTVVLRY